MAAASQRLRKSVPQGRGGVTTAPRGLVYVTDQAPGISRYRRRGGFTYRSADGRSLRSPHQLARIRSLAIPPAYTAVWICPQAEGHLQATGRDARGRKQYRYHALWRTARDGDKFGRMWEFAFALPRIRERVACDLRAQPGAGKQQVRRHTLLAALIRLLDTTLIRVGNEAYTRTNGSFGLTTLRNRHARIHGDRIQLSFRGKSGVARNLSLADARVARIVRTCQAMPGQELFQFADHDGRLHGIGSADVNLYLREASGADFTAKDFRTWHASVHALALLNRGPHAHVAMDQHQLHAVLVEVAQRLGNTVTVCRNSYVHPLLLELAASGGLQQRMHDGPKSRRSRLSEDEVRLLHFLRRVHHPHKRSR